MSTCLEGFEPQIAPEGKAVTVREDALCPEGARCILEGHLLHCIYLYVCG